MAARSVSFNHFRSSSPRASATARILSAKRGTRSEKLLRSQLWVAGYRFRANVASLPGKPDIVFSRAKVAVFCDGDFWHGKRWIARRERLLRGSNAAYWIGKIEGNMARDRRQTRALRSLGWRVVRIWESEITANPSRAAAKIIKILEARLDTTRRTI